MRRRREALALTQQGVADRMGIAKSTYVGWETGRNGITPGYRPLLASALDVSLAEVASWFEPEALAPDGLSTTWLGTLAALEQGASELWAFQPIAIHALLQTASYAAAVERTAIGPPTDAEVNHWVQLRLARQQVIDRTPEPFSLSVVLDESVLHRVAGNEQVMAEQLDHLATMAERPNIDVRLLGLRPGTFAAGFGAFTLLASPRTTTPFMVVLTDRGTAHYFERPDAVREHSELFTHLRGVALSQADSISLIRTVAQEYRT